MLSARSLYLWTATIAFFFATVDLNTITPDALVSAFMLLSAAALLEALAGGSLLAWAAVGVCAGLAFWAKAFALPFFAILILTAAVANLRNLRVLGRLAAAAVVFALVAAPLLVQISALRGRFTYGDSGRLNAAWLVNRADHYNPVADLSVYNKGTAIAHFKHPGELLAKTPFIAYYGGPQSFGSTPQWTDASYWFDGLAPRFSLRQTAAAVRSNLAVLASLAVMRMQVVVLAALLACWGFRIRKQSWADRVVPALVMTAVACIGLYAVVYPDGRYIAFALVLIAVVYAGCSLNRSPAASQPSLHAALVLAAALMLVFSLQNALREAKALRAEGARPMNGVFSMPMASAGAALARIYPHGSEVACMGDSACMGDPYWVRAAGMRMTAIVAGGNGFEPAPAERGCVELARNPSALDALRKKSVLAIVGRFDGAQACTANWHPLGDSPHMFYLDLGADVH
jgi:hypothetical protein